MEGKVNMLMGKYTHSLDSKNRLIIPSKLKEQLGNKVIISPSTDKCLKLYSQEEWGKLAAKISELPATKVSAIVRSIYSKAIEVEPDNQGRVMLTQELLSFAGITKNVLTAGCGNYAEIWAEEIWNDMNMDEGPENLRELLEELGL